MTSELFAAIESFNARRLKDLLEKGADANAVSAAFPFLRPMHAAIIAVDEGGPTEAVRLLLQHGADINRTYPGLGASTPLLCALYNDQIPTARFLLEAGADPSISSDEGESPLHWAVENGDAEMLDLLLQKGADKTIDKSSALEGRTALGMAVQRLNVQMVRRLLEAGANPEVIDFNRDTAEECLPTDVGDRQDAVAEIRSLLRQERAATA